MATITGLTAERMLEIEAASVVDGNVVGNDLFLAKHDGSIINAGNVRGPAGPTGPIGASLPVLAAVDLSDVGSSGQLRAGRQLSVADFTALGLAAPAGLWNLSNFNDSSGNARHLTNKGSVPLGVGIGGLASSAAQFAGLATQALYILDSGAADPFRLRTGTWGCWLQTNKRGGSAEYAMMKASTGGFAWGLSVQANGTISVDVYPDGTAPAGFGSGGVADTADGRWHFCVGTYDGNRLRSYVDGLLDAETYATGAAQGMMQAVAGTFTIGGYYGDAANTAQPWNGRLAQAFVTHDVLSEEQVRNLYCARIPHGLGSVPADVKLSVRRRKRGGPLVAGDFPAQPARLHNFAAAALTDLGSNNVTLTNPGVAPAVAGPDGVLQNAFYFAGAGGVGLQGTDTGLPNALLPRSSGVWIRTIAVTGTLIALAWGTANTAESSIVVSAGTVRANSSADTAIGPFVADGLWHHVVHVEDNAAVDGIKRKLYLDGRVVSGSTVMNTLTLAGATRFRVGAYTDGTLPWLGSLSRAFVYAGALTEAQVRAIYNKGSQALPPKPKPAEEYVEAMSATDLLVTFEAIEASDLIDLAVMA